MARFCTFLHLFALSCTLFGRARRDRANGKVEISDETTDDGPLTTGQGERWHFLALFGTIWHLLSPPFGARRKKAGRWPAIGDR